MTDSLRSAARTRACHGAVAALFLSIMVLIPGGLDQAWAGHGDGGPTLTGLRPEYVRRLVDAKSKLALVDLRRSHDYQAGHLPGAISLPLADLETRYGEIPTAEQVVLYCQCPIEDLVAAFLFLHAKGYGNLTFLEDGFDGWLGRRYPIVK